MNPNTLLLLVMAYSIAGVWTHWRMRVWLDAVAAYHLGDVGRVACEALALVAWPVVWIIAAVLWWWKRKS